MKRTEHCNLTRKIVCLWICKFLSATLFLEVEQLNFASLQMQVNITNMMSKRLQVLWRFEYNNQKIYFLNLTFVTFDVIARKRCQFEATFLELRNQFLDSSQFGGANWNKESDQSLWYTLVLFLLYYWIKDCFQVEIKNYCYELYSVIISL